jgi:hypothetical protein
LDGRFDARSRRIAVRARTRCGNAAADATTDATTDAADATTDAEVTTTDVADATTDAEAMTIDAVDMVVATTGRTLATTVRVESATPGKKEGAIAVTLAASRTLKTPIVVDLAGTMTEAIVHEACALTGKPVDATAVNPVALLTKVSNAPKVYERSFEHEYSRSLQ